MFTKFITVILTTIFLSTSVFGTAIYSSKNIHHPVIGKNGMVSSQEKHATEIGLSILKQGGNAIDAAVAVGFALAVTLPRAGNLGGGGFMMIHDASSSTTTALDYREVAPLRSHKDLFLDEEGNPSSNLSQKTLLSTGVPGTVAGLITALETYGTLRLSTVIQPAINLAENGFKLSIDVVESLEYAKDSMSKYPETFKTFFKADGSSYSAGEVLKQPDLALSLKLISDYGKKGFYSGYIAKQFISYSKKQKGLISQKDLDSYTPIFRNPVQGDYKGYTIYAMPPPSSGGIHLIQLLKLLEPYPLKNKGHNSAASIHIMVEAMKLAYADRSTYLGDPDYVSIPMEKLISSSYIDERRLLLSENTPLPSSEILPGNPYNDLESDETTHFSIVDKWGNCVSNTYTLNFSYGNKQMIPGTGILLNNEMDDFSAKPGSINAYGLIGGEKNAILPQKRMLSSMTPTIVFEGDKPFLITGSPGGSRIITTVLQLILNIVDYDMNIADATHAKRIHHQWYPDEIRLEEGLSPDTINLLIEKGHLVSTKGNMGSTQSILIKNNSLFGASDPRRPGALTVGY
jgi:gamma-glutamyltranspeptidase / glutathione hydrolase